MAALIGGSAGRVRAYASSMKRDIAPKTRLSGLVRLCAEKALPLPSGASELNAARISTNGPAGRRRSFRWSQKALGDRIDKLVDANSGFSVPRAIAVGNLLADHGIGHYEEPVPYWDWTPPAR